MSGVTFCLLCREQDLRETPMASACARCGGPACATHDFCFGCERVICEACNTAPASRFAFAGDTFTHPHFPDLVPVA